jgi:hypothetical protein
VTKEQERRWTEQERTDALDDLCGGPDLTFRLRNLHTSAIQTTSGDRFRLHAPKRTVASVFTLMALRDGYTKEQVSAFLNY